MPRPDRVFPGPRALEPAKRPTAIISGLGERRLAEFHPKWHTEKAEGPAIT
jgi:hypothetical protein